MKRTILLLIALASAACTQSATWPADDDFTLSQGTSFGMCMGYCIVVMDVSGTTVTVTKSSHFPAQYPDSTSTFTLTGGEADRLRRLARTSGIAALEGVHGCPDCADGGAEWIEVRTPTDSVRATFEYGAVLEPIADLQAELRALRRRVTEG
jgi:hypothetical protein